MLHIHATMEDQTIVLELHDAKRATLRVFDAGGRGGTETREITCEQAGAIMALAIAGDEIGETGQFEGLGLSQMLYAIAEPAVDGLPHELRPIP